MWFKEHNTLKIKHIGTIDYELLKVIPRKINFRTKLKTPCLFKETR
jgi:hypothetical protein